MKTAEKICEKLCQNGFQAFLVGGYVRDLLMELDSTDIDIATDATPDQIIKLFADRKVKLVGKNFGVVIVDDIEVATFRKDRYAGLSSKDCQVSYSETIQDDLSRRDLTINAIAICANTGDIVDISAGIKDIKKHKIRFVGNADDRIYEDPNRIIRACRFLSRIDGVFSKDTLNALIKNRELIRNVDTERIGKEIIKCMKTAKFSSMFFGSLQTIGILKYILPSLARCWNHPHGNHHIETIYDHSMMVGDNISCKFPLLKLAAYLHDIGKPLSYNYETKKFINHETIGADIIHEELRNLKFSNIDINYISNIIRCHMISTKDITPKTIRKIRKRLSDNNVNVRDWIRLKLADRLGNLNKNPKTISEMRQIINNFLKIKDEPVKINVTILDITGDDIMKEFNIPPGKLVGKILKELLEFVLETGFESNQKIILIEKAKEIFDNEKERS